jgi:hypothetical protein
MSLFPSAEKELAELDAVLAGAGADPRAGDPAFEDLRKRAERVSLRISNPIRVAVLGLPGAGKALLAGFLVGERIGRPRKQSGEGLPVILRYGERSEAYLSWWSGIDIPLPGNDLSGVGEHNPDYVEFRLPNPVLRFLSFMSLPGGRDWNAQKEQVRWVASRADILIWCVAAEGGWTDEERQLWALVPRRLQAQSLLVVTHPPEPPEGTPLGPLPETEIVGAKTQFHDVIGIATADALTAAPSGKVADPAAWDKAGGKALVGSLLGVARLARRNDIALAREILNRLGPPQSAAPAAAPAPSAPAAPAEPAPAPKPPAPQASPAPAPAPVPFAFPKPDPAPPKPAPLAQSPVPAPKPVMPTLPPIPKAPADPQPEPEKTVEAPPESPPGPAPVLPRRVRGTATKIFDELLAAYVGDSTGGEAASDAGPEAEPTTPAAPDAAEVPQSSAAAAPAPRQPAPAPAPAAAAAKAAAEPPGLRRLLEGIDGLVAYADDEAGFKDWEYMARVTGLVEELAEVTSAPRAMREEGTWVARQVEEAFIQLSLMQLEQGEQPCLDASTVLLQLARDIAWSEAGGARA